MGLDTLQPSEIVCPLTGEVIEGGDIDGLLDTYERVKAHKDVLDAAMSQMRYLIGSLSMKAGSRTTRVAGTTKIAKIVWPANKWDQQAMKVLRTMYEEDYGPRYIRIDRVAPNLREVKKLRATTGGESFTTFKKALLAAESPSTAPPTITIE